MSSAATLEARAAVRSACADIEPGEVVLVACSGGPDSMALAAMAAWAADRDGWRAGAVVVNHGLQAGSRAIAERAATACRTLGLEPVEVVDVVVGSSGGPEAAARDARYAALTAAADALGARAVLLGHTMQDQAETVLLRLARGSGARSLAAMAPVNGRWRRPFLDLDRDDIATVAEEALAPIGEQVWRDPHNDDPRFTRVRARAALRDLERDLGPGIVPALARSARLLRDDADALDALADDAWASIVVTDASGSWTSIAADVSALSDLPRAVRTRVLRRMCLAAGSVSEDLTADHIAVVERFVTEWSGQGRASLPGRVTAHREYGRLTVIANPDLE